MRLMKILTVSPLQYLVTQWWIIFTNWRSHMMFCANIILETYFYFLKCRITTKCSYCIIDLCLDLNIKFWKDAYSVILPCAVWSTIYYVGFSLINFENTKFKLNVYKYAAFVEKYEVRHRVSLNVKFFMDLLFAYYPLSWITK